jgi:hypothetical protein
MSTPSLPSAGASSANLDKIYKEEDYEPQPAEVASHGHDLEKATTTRSTHPLEQVTPVRKYSGFKWFLVLFALYSSAFLYGLDNTIVADVQVAVVEQFGSVEKIGWLGIGFPLGSIAVILSVGRAFGLFDVKWYVSLPVY